jgi:hypothetical protein
VELTAKWASELQLSQELLVHLITFLEMDLETPLQETGHPAQTRRGKEAQTRAAGRWHKIMAQETAEAMEPTGAMALPMLRATEVLVVTAALVVAIWVHGQVAATWAAHGQVVLVAEAVVAAEAMEVAVAGNNCILLMNL